MKTTELSAASVVADSYLIPSESPFVMLNLLRYKTVADYGNDSSTIPCSGREAYFTRYIPAFIKITTALGLASVQPIFVGAARAAIVCPEEESWDDIALVSYPDYAAFRKVVESAEYMAIADEHRKAALEDWRLIAATSISF